MTTFTEFKEKQPAVLEQQQLILERCEGLCWALRDQYCDYQIRSYKISQAKDPDNCYWQQRIDEYMVGEFSMRFVIESGRKYHKIIMEDGANRSVHAFVDKKSGDVYKAASWKAPAKGVRYNLVSKDNYEMLKARCDWSGGYLYK